MGGGGRRRGNFFDELGFEKRGNRFGSAGLVAIGDDDDAVVALAASR
jgi:hypothetical protein